MYAIVDIETTGGYAAANGITEISIHVFDGEKVVETFESLVNPRQPIPRYIQAMTGITDEMVEKAPGFETLAEKIYNILENKIFIAHNVNFDYSFVKGHLSACGYELKDRKLCTVRLSRKILPGLPSYSLGNLCHSLGIKINNRHRAGGDTEATVSLFRHLISNDKEQHIQKSLLRNSKEQALPPHVPKAHFDALPYTPGVYYFHNEKGKVIYVGKANNIRYRVNGHFTNNSAGRQKQNFLRYTHSISYQRCGTELMACILESTEIKNKWPMFNQSQKRWEDVYGIFQYEDQNGYLRLAIDKNRKRLNPVHTFHYLTDGHTLLRRLIKEWELCPRLCFMQASAEPCSEGSGCRGACERKETISSYNARVQEAIRTLQTQPSFAIIDEGISPEERSCILVCEGKFYGMGYIPHDVQISGVEEILDHLTVYKENSFIRNLIHNYAASHPAKVIVLKNNLLFNPAIESPHSLA